jgi:methionyl-tRNA formyltransferase
MDGSIIIQKLQIPGKKSISSEEFYKGYKPKIGDLIG